MGYRECGNIIWGPKNAGNSLTEDLLASEEGLCSMELITNVKLDTSRSIADHNAVSQSFPTKTVRFLGEASQT